MKKIAPVILLFVIFSGLSACGDRSKDQTGPVISDIKTSGNVLVISDCSATSVTISTQVIDPAGVESVLFWYRVPDQPFASIGMKLQGGVYQVSVDGAEFLGKGYGTMEFYITTKDAVGNLSQSSIDQSIQFLPCVNN